MYAAIRCYEGSGALTEELMRAGRQLSALLARKPGFMSFEVLEAARGHFAWVCRFDDEESLAEADRRAVEWLTSSLGALIGNPTEVLAGEVIVQRGL